MKLSRALFFSVFLVSVATAACGGGDTSGSSNGGSTSTGGSGTGGSAGSTGGSTAGSGGTGGSAGGTGGSTAGSGGTGGTTTTTTTSSMMAVADPTKDGPYTTTTLDDTITSNNKQVPIHCVYPTGGGPEAGPYPVVVIAHGFQLPASQYSKYAERLATFGYVALTADYPNSLFTPDNPEYAAALSAGLDWAKAKLPNAANSDLAGVTGHSLGGKVSLLAATKDARFKASIVLDPVDGGGGPGGACNPPGCVDVSALMPTLNIPTGFLGETTDAQGGFQPCAPAAENFQTFYAGANSPSFAVTIKGANHMSFLDDVASCGFTCGFCNMATLDNATVNGIARGYVVAFYERHLRNNAGYDTWLTGQMAQDLYVTPGTATIESK